MGTPLQRSTTSQPTSLLRGDSAHVVARHQGRQATGAERRSLSGDDSNFAAMNEVYAKYFTLAPPARSTVQVARLPKDALVEIEIIAGL
jgi:hypothetical protein